MTDEKDNPGVFVRVEDCRERHTKMDLALFGLDGRGGIVKDIQDIKAYSGIVRQVAVPIVIAVLSAGLTAWLLKFL